MTPEASMRTEGIGKEMASSFAMPLPPCELPQQTGLVGGMAASSISIMPCLFIAQRIRCVVDIIPIRFTE